MSVKEVENILEKMSESDNWNLYTLKYKHTKRKGSVYETKQICFRNPKDLSEHITSIQHEYCSKRLKNYEGLRKYDGTFHSAMIYFLNQTDGFVKEEIKLLNESLANPEIGSKIDDASDGSENAFVIQGSIEDDEGKEQLIKLISLKKPFILLKNKFYYEDGEYAKMTEKVLNLGITFDILIAGDEKVYFMNFNGEKLFNMERVYKGICAEAVTYIGNANILNDFQLFSEIAASGHNPRKFISYDSQKLKYMTDSENRKKIAKKFNIKLDNKGKINTSDINNINKFIKFLCGRAVLDPTNLEPKESDGTRKWS